MRSADVVSPQLNETQDTFVITREQDEVGKFLELLDLAIPPLIGRRTCSLGLSNGGDLEVARKFCDQNFFGVAYVTKTLADPVCSLDDLQTYDFVYLENKPPNPEGVYRLSLNFVGDANESCVVIVMKTSLFMKGPTLDGIQIIRVPEYHAKIPLLTAESLLGMIPSLFDLVLKQKLSKCETSLCPGDIELVRSRILRLELELNKLSEISSFETEFKHHPEIVKAVLSAKASGRKIGLEDLNGLEGDQVFVSELEDIAKSWITLIKMTTLSIKSTPVKSVKHEIVFWKSAKSAIERLEYQLNGEEVILSLAALGAARKFRYKIALSIDTELECNKRIIYGCNKLMSCIRLDDIFIAGSIVNLKKSILNVLQHLESKFNPLVYPFSRMLAFCEHLSNLASSVVGDILLSMQLLCLEYTSFRETINECLTIFNIIDAYLIKIKTLNNSTTSSNLSTVTQTPFSSTKLYERLKNVKRFRDDHEKFVSIIENIHDNVSMQVEFNHEISDVANDDKVSVLAHLRKAYDNLSNSINISDISSEGIEKWTQAVDRYSRDVSFIEDIITSQMIKLLNNSSCQSTVFRIILKFSSILMRPKIHSIVKGYQNELLSKIEMDLEVIKDSMKTPFMNTEEYILYHLRGVSLYTARLLRNKYIDSRLGSISDHIELLFGSSFFETPKGRKMYDDIKSIRDSTAKSQDLSIWIDSIASNSGIIEQEIFRIRKKRGLDGRDTNVLVMNIDKEMVSYCRDYNVITHYIPVIPHKTEKTLENIIKVSHFIPILEETVRSYSNSLSIMSKNETARSALEKMRFEVQEKLADVLGVTWKDMLDINHSAFVEKGLFNKKFNNLEAFIDVVLKLDTELKKIVNIQNDIEVLITALESCVLEKGVIFNILNNIQNNISQLPISEFECAYTNVINRRTSNIIVKKLEEQLKAWNELPLRFENHAHCYLLKDFNSLLKTPFRHIISEQNGNNYSKLGQEMTLFIHMLDTMVRDIINLPFIIPNVYEQKMTDRKNYLANRAYILNTSVDSIAITLRKIIERYNSVREYYLYWHEQYKLVRSNLLERVTKKCGDDIKLWGDTLKVIIRSRRAAENMPSTYEMFPWIIEANCIKKKICDDYEHFQHEVERLLYTIMINRAEKLRLSLSEKLEIFREVKVDPYDVRYVTEFLSSIVRMKAEMSILNEKISDLVNLLSLLESIGSSHIQGSVVNILKSSSRVLNRCLNDKEAWIYGKKDIICANIVVVYEESKKAMSDCKKSLNYIRSKIDITELDQLLDMLEALCFKLKKVEIEHGTLQKAGCLFGVEMLGFEDLFSVKEEVSYLYKTYKVLQEPHNIIKNLVNITLDQHACTQAIDQIEMLSVKLAQISSPSDHTETYRKIYEDVDFYVRKIPILKLLESGVIKNRHLSHLTHKHGIIKKNMQDIMTIGEILKSDLSVDNPMFKEIVSTAREEKSIEDCITRQEETWINSRIEISTQSQAIRTILNIDHLISTFSESLLTSSKLKSSVHFSKYLNRIMDIEEKLSIAVQLFHTWAEAQRQLVYLAGMFVGNIEIEQVLSDEVNSLNIAVSSYNALLESMRDFPSCITPNLISKAKDIVHSILNSLRVVRRSLYDYIRRERRDFYRFYLLGVEELLEMVGSGVKSLFGRKYLHKMFLGVSNLISNEDSNLIVGLKSKEGEIFYLVNPIKVNTAIKVKDVLKELDVEIKNSMAVYLSRSYEELGSEVFGNVNIDFIFNWIESYPSQVTALIYKVLFTQSVQTALEKKNSSGICQMKNIKLWINEFINALIHRITITESFLKIVYQNLLLEVMRQLNIVNSLISRESHSTADFMWISQLRVYYRKNEPSIWNKVNIRILIYSFDYGYEYHGIPESLVYTSLIHNSLITMCSSMSNNYGGCLYGPSGTGKTEAVKFLGNLLGRHVVVFCCDNRLDFESMGVILTGLSKIGAWGCFDEFNRLEGGVMSAVSQLIRDIQLGLKNTQEITLLDEKLSVNANTGVFITMNPNYLGRSSIPANLKSLFRGMSVTNSKALEIACIILCKEGFKETEDLASKLVNIMKICEKRLIINSNDHYDFSLRMLKNVLICANNLKNKQVSLPYDSPTLKNLSEEIIAESLNILIFPRLTKIDKCIYKSTLNFIFKNTEKFRNPINLKHETLKRTSDFTCHSDGTITSVLSLHNVLNLMNGVIITGPSNSGKTHLYKTLFNIYETQYNRKGFIYVINPRVLGKDYLFGRFLSTGEWEDGLFTQIVRSLSERDKVDSHCFYWIVFDGDIDPDWVENLNSVLDENKVLTAQNGERFYLDNYIKIIFETDNLENTTPATISRCGLIRLDEDIGSIKIRTINMFRDTLNSQIKTCFFSSENLRKFVLEFLMSYLCEDSTGLIFKALSNFRNYNHIIEPSIIRVIDTMLTLTKTSLNKLSSCYEREGNLQNVNNEDEVRKFLIRESIFNIVWSFSGDMLSADRNEYFKDMLQSIKTAGVLISNEHDFMKYSIDVLISGSFCLLKPPMSPVLREIRDTDSHHCYLDMAMYGRDILVYEYLIKSLILSSPITTLIGRSGAGVTAIILSALGKMADISVLEVNFSTSTSVETVLEALEYVCVYKPIAVNAIMSPKCTNSNLIVVCRGIHLPKLDRFNFNPSLSFLLQLVNNKRLWHKKRNQWIEIERIKFVVTFDTSEFDYLSVPRRLTEKGGVITVDTPKVETLLSECKRVCNASLRHLKCAQEYEDEISNSTADLYLLLKSKFQLRRKPYFLNQYSPQTLLKWINDMSLNTKDMGHICIESFVAIWIHEALRTFQDRLMESQDKAEIKEYIFSVASKYYSQIVDIQNLGSHLYFSFWISRSYSKVSLETIREFVENKLSLFGGKRFGDIVLTNEVLEHMLKIIRALDFPRGHLVLIGPRNSGKTCILKMTALIDSINVFQLMIHKDYNNDEFRNDIRSVLQSAVVNNEKTCFTLRESDLVIDGLPDFINDVISSVRFDFVQYKKYSDFLESHDDGTGSSSVNLSYSPDLLLARIKKNLHIVIVQSSPNSKVLPLDIYEKCTINSVSELSNDSLRQISRNTMERLGMDTCTIDSLCDAFLYLNDTLNRNHKRECSSMSLWRYLNLMSHFSDIYTHKITELEDNKKHLTTGLDKINTAYEDVSKLKTILNGKDGRLKDKDAKAKEKLAKMLDNQREAEKKKLVMIENKKQYHEKRQKAEKRRQIVLKELSDIQPLLEEAKANVGNIRKHQLAEVRTMTNPPVAVKVAVESVCILLGHKIDSWKDVQAVLRKDDFITSILNHKADAIDVQVQKELSGLIEGNPEINVEVVNRASKACGPLYLWALAQIKYSCIISRVNPLKIEVRNLEKELSVIETVAEKLSTTIEILEQSITSYQVDYSLLMNEVQTLKNEMDYVQKQIYRNISLLQSLASEKERWEAGIHSYQSRLRLTLGDSILAAAHLSFFGPLEESQRSSLLQRVSSYLDDICIVHSRNFCAADYLSTLSERTKWRYLLKDCHSFYIENIIIMLKSLRYTLVLDSSGQISDLIVSLHKNKGICVSSFREKGLLKTVKECVKLGIPLLLKNAEYYDSTLDNLVRRDFDYSEASGTVVNIGPHKVNVSKNFFLFLFSEEDLDAMSPFMLNHTSIVNFTTTDENIQTTCLNAILKYEKSDLEKRKNESIRLQWEYKIRLRKLEERLLKLLNDARIDILEDKDLLTTLESLKSESSEINKEAAKTDILIEEINESSEIYKSATESCKALYTILKTVSAMSLSHIPTQKFFLNAVNRSLEKCNSHIKSSDYSERLEKIKEEISRNVFIRASRYLNHEHKMVFGIFIFCMILKDQSINRTDLLTLMKEVSNSNKRDYFLTILNGGSSERVGVNLSHKILTKGDAINMFVEYLTVLSSKCATDIKKLLVHPSPAEVLARLGEHRCDIFPRRILNSAHMLKFFGVCLILLLRIDSFVSALSMFLKEVFLHDVFGDLSLNIMKTCEETEPVKPIVVLFSGEYDDPGAQIEDISREQMKKISTISLGSIESCRIAERLIASAALNGSWVLLKGSHFSLEWVMKLELFLKEMTLSPDFKLFIIMRADALSKETHFSENFSIIVEEPRASLKVSLEECLHRVKGFISLSTRKEELRVYFMFFWVHSVIRERFRYVPIGWTKVYDITTLDFDTGVKVIKEWIELSNGKFDEAFFDSMRESIFDTVYKLTIDTEQDIEVLMILGSKYMHNDIFREIELCPLIAECTGLQLPYFDHLDDYFMWVKNIPAIQMPTWLSLPCDAEKFRMESRGASIVTNFNVVFDGIMRRENNNMNGTSGSPLQLSAHSFSTSEELLTNLSQLSKSWDLEVKEVSSEDPVQLYFIKELNIIHNILRIARKDIQMLLSSQKDMSLRSEKLLSHLLTNTTPDSWHLPLKCYNTSTLCSWIKAVSRITENQANTDARCISILQLLDPSAFIDAVIQRECQKHQYCHKSVVLTNTDTSTQADLSLYGLVLEGGVQINSSTIHSLHTISRQSVTLHLQCHPSLSQLAQEYFMVHVYNSKLCTEALFSVYIKISNNSVSERERLRLYGTRLVPDDCL